MELKEAQYLDSILRRGGVSVTNVDDVPDSIITMLATYRYIRIVDKRSDGIAYLIETTDEGGQFLARGGFTGIVQAQQEAKEDKSENEKDRRLNRASLKYGIALAIATMIGLIVQYVIIPFFSKYL